MDGSKASTQRGAPMAAVKIGPKHQVTIPREVFEALHLGVGDFLDAEARGGQIILSPLQLAAKAPAAKLSAAEQRRLPRTRAKIARIQEDLGSARGLSTEEAEVAAKAGLIDPDQKYWWTEEWQRGEREAGADRKKGGGLGSFEWGAAMQEAMRNRP